MDKYLVKKELPTEVKEINLIKVETTVGSGSEKDPYRNVVALYNKNGQFITVIEDIYLFSE
ncbi:MULTISPECIES: hypothetical protein [Staphylococcus]|uniref:hypothetical protein n=1 Tax=Staphylococcus TaxID=1279 RepID=UPI0008530687|nr:MULTISPECIES: hypothetical protein [Staphylococcus]MDW4018942.1 hypothetical protein [Staphylococcus saprophyticus]MDW4271893.1 hypothetical protein [Staphylococcus saprophyticus]MDW4443356.1 hypothetical protein [Staphylococcus saprophyticus]MDW4486444.1 hypothetical protein [Staphylococcus saprophyticus]OEK29692.1 hypothetical protein ASS85_10885 [Staphylococcus saprophyticus]